MKDVEIIAYIASIITLFLITLIGIIIAKNKKIKQNKEEINKLTKQMDDKISIINNITTDKNELEKEVKKLINKYSSIINIEEKIEELSQAKFELENSLSKIKEYYSDYEIKVDLEEMSYYQPKFDFDNYLELTDALILVREAQKELIKSKRVFLTGNIDKNNKNISNLAVSAYNSDATTIINSVTYTNYENSKQKLEVIYNKTNNLLSDFRIAISDKYHDLKVQEMALVYDLKEKEQRIKEEQQELKDQMKEEEKARAEAEKAREKAIKEQEQYEKALEEARLEIEQKTGSERKKYEDKILKLEEKLKEALEERQRATSMAQITKKGHVYIISNIGSFGENVFKIGMTRRKEPKDRVKELGDASVPFPFDIHAMIYTDNAPTLEKELHNEFNKRRLNKINLRKEFFNVTIDEIEQKCKELGVQVKLTKLAEALEYQQTKDLEKNKLS